MVPSTRVVEEAIEEPPLAAVYQFREHPDGAVTFRSLRVVVPVAQKVWGELAVGAAGSGFMVNETPVPLINMTQLPNGNLEAFTFTTVGLVVNW